MAGMLSSDGSMVNPAAMTMLLNSIGGIVQSSTPPALKLSQLADVTKNPPPGISPDVNTLLKLVNQKANAQLDATVNPDAANGNGTGQGAAVTGTPNPYSISGVVEAIRSVPQQMQQNLASNADQLKTTASDISTGIDAAVAAINNYFN